MRALLALVLLGCGEPSEVDEPEKPYVEPTQTTSYDSGATTPTTAEGYCAVVNLVDRSCLGCHSALSQQGGLDLETDLAAVVLEPGNTGAPLVVPGDAEDSLLFQQVRDAVMPPFGPPQTADEVALMRSWIDAGATRDCGENR